MRLDFHFYTIYALARAAGFKPEDAYVIAYSSQYTDDEASPEPIDFEDGSSFEPHITAHSLYTLQTISDRICKLVWIPFHFVAGNQGEGDERLITRANGDVIQRIIEDFLENYSSVRYSPHLLGIILHAYADTWSHQNFMGQRNDSNKVRNIAVDGEAGDFVEWLITETSGEHFIPNLGHAQAASVPDEPNRRWGYNDYQGDYLAIVNRERALEAAQNCYDVLIKFLQKRPDLQSSPALGWPDISAPIAGLFATQGDLKDCVTAWGDAISKGNLGFPAAGKDINLIYDAGEWFNTAINTEEERSSDGEAGEFIIKHLKTDDFENSNFKLFNDAAGTYYSALFIKAAQSLGLEQVMI